MTRQEFQNLIEQHGKEIYSFCCRLTGNKEEADELYQEVMLKTMENRVKIDYAANPKSFLIGIAVGIVKNNRKKYARRQRIAPSGPITEEIETAFLVSREISPEEQYITQEVIQLVRQETEALPDKYRIPVYMYYTAEMPVSEIARILHIPAGTVKSRLHKARIIIRKRLEDYGYEK